MFSKEHKKAEVHTFIYSIQRSVSYTSFIWSNGVGTSSSTLIERSRCNTSVSFEENAEVIAPIVSLLESWLF